MPSKLQAARKERRWSQPRLIAELERHARANHITVASRTSLKSLVSRWENGHAVPDESHRRLLRQVYGRTDAELGIEPPLATTGRMPRVTSVEAWELTDALTRRTISSSTLAQLEQATFECAERYPSSTPSQLLPVVQIQLTRLRDALQYPQSVTTRRRTVALCGVLAGLAGNLSLDSSDERRAHAYFDAAAIAAAEAEDADLSAWVLATRSIIPFYGGKPTEALTMLEKATDLAARGSGPRRRSWVTAQGHEPTQRHTSPHWRLNPWTGRTA